MAQSFRKSQIVAEARHSGQVTVDGLVARFGVTPQTIRRDLAELAEDGLLERVHGGAIPASGTANIAHGERARLNAAGKQAIARAVARDLPGGASVFLNIGTTTEAVAEALTGHADLLAVTNNMNVAARLAATAKVIVTGGTLRPSDGALVGTLAEASVRQFKFDYAVIGCSALDDAGDILDFDIEEVAVSQSIIARSRRVFLVADHSKLGRPAPARIGSLADVDALYTDAELPEGLAARCTEWGTRVKVC
ncbi:DeoR/GlpR family DNA-binding transcription regulator [Mesobacterium pallidum]|uniref:DeoR/GlpR family DNA-binding transcription regulator n=1 Tax=Mesobacterium pallidum TaxID=2872037 RepID=UPI001EE1BFD4|nr:DeoR/GlpR family DNA-binding transcription regulator [Mesobacterium pallidum]